MLQFVEVATVDHVQRGWSDWEESLPMQAWLREPTTGALIGWRCVLPGPHLVVGDLTPEEVARRLPMQDGDAAEVTA